MTIEKVQKITYADLISGVYEKIVSICGNVDGYSSSSSLRSGHTYKASYNSNPGSAQSSGLNVTATMESSSYLSTVNSSTVKSQLESFFASRGLDSKSGEYVSTRGMINFYANLAAFLSAHAHAERKHSEKVFLIRKIRLLFFRAECERPLLQKGEHRLGR